MVAAKLVAFILSMGVTSVFKMEAATKTGPHSARYLKPKWRKPKALHYTVFVKNIKSSDVHLGKIEQTCDCHSALVSSHDKRLYAAAISLPPSLSGLSNSAIQHVV